VKVLIADDQRVVREGLATIVASLDGIEVVGLAADGAEAVALVAECRPEVVLMDLRMPRLGGAEATSAIRAAHPDVAVVVLTTYADDESVLEALAAGATGYLTKDAARDDIRRALEAAASGQSVLDARAQAVLVKAAAGRPAAVASEPGRSPERPDGLTEREVEVLALIGAGLSNTEIAGRLYVSEATVKTHVNHIFAKTASRDRSQATAYAHRHGLVGP
jgi:DNA-binding NarL/FixJ family response regulator